MSVHDDGPPSWSKPAPAPPVAFPSPARKILPDTMSGIEPADAPLSNEWVNPIEFQAVKLLTVQVGSMQNITSLDFKKKLREVCSDIEPAPRITQEDVSKFLKRWFLNIEPSKWMEMGCAEKAGYAFREHKSTSGATYNEYFYSPTRAGRQEEKQLEEEIVNAQLSGEAPTKGLWAWIKRRFGK